MFTGDEVCLLIELLAFGDCCQDSVITKIPVAYHLMSCIEEKGTQPLICPWAGMFGKPRYAKVRFYRQRVMSVVAKTKYSGMLQ